MTNLNLSFLLIAFVFLFSCTEKNTTNELSNKGIIQFEIPQNLDKSNVKRFNVSDIYSTIDGFELDRAAGPIGKISKALIYNDILYVLDSRYAKKIFAFDLLNHGQFLLKIGNAGKGPGEFLKIVDFSIDKFSKSLIVVDARQRKLAFFHLDGTYYNEQKFDFSPLTFFCDSNYYYFIKSTSDESENGMVITDKKFQTVKELLHSNDYPTNTNVNSKFIVFNNKSFLNYHYCDTIYKINDGNIKPYLALTSNGKSLFAYLKRANLDSKTYRELFQNILSSRSVIPVGENVFIPRVYFEDNKIQMFSFSVNGKFKSIFDIKNDSISPSLSFMIDDKIGTVFNPISYDEKYGTLSVLGFYQLKKIKTSKLENNKEMISDRLFNAINNMNPDSNPFIVFYK